MMHLLNHIVLLQELLFTSDKIYSVLVVILIIFAVVIYMLIRQERKLNHLEDKMKEKDS